MFKFIILLSKKNVEISYVDFNTTFEIVYFARILEKVEVTKQPNKTDYMEEEEFDPTGMVVTATYADGIVREVEDYSISEIKGTGEVELVISYGEKSTKITINVTAYGGIDELKALLAGGDIKWDKNGVYYTMSLDGNVVRFWENYLKEKEN